MISDSINQDTLFVVEGVVDLTFSTKVLIDTFEFKTTAGFIQNKGKLTFNDDT